MSEQAYSAVPGGKGPHGIGIDPMSGEVANYAYVGIYAGNGKMYGVMGQNEGTIEHEVNWNGAGDTEYIRVVHPKK